jgi:hypothetical protein
VRHLSAAGASDGACCGLGKLGGEHGGFRLVGRGPARAV